MLLVVPMTLLVANTVQAEATSIPTVECLCLPTVTLKGPEEEVVSIKLLIYGKDQVAKLANQVLQAAT